MLDASVQRILDELSDDATLLDVGGGVRPLNRADCVLDALPYADRAGYGSLGPEPARFTSDTWITRDACDKTPWPFADDQFDFAVCSHTLEDVRDPIWMCAELNRVAKAGYIEVPSRLEEQSYGFQGPWTGWSHHRWLIDVDQPNAHISFVHKSGVVERDGAHFPAYVRSRIPPEDRIHTLWWQGSFSYEERLFWDAAEFDAYLTNFVADELARRKLTRSRWRNIAGRLRA